MIYHTVNDIVIIYSTSFCSEAFSLDFSFVKNKWDDKHIVQAEVDCDWSAIMINYLRLFSFLSHLG